MSEGADALIDRSLARALRRLSRHGRLSPDPVPDWAEQREGSWNGRPLVMRTRFLTAGGKVRRVHLSRVTGDASSLTLVAVPPASLDAPMLGVELISFRGIFTLIGLDLAPTTSPVPRPHARRLVELSGGIRRRGRERPRGEPFSEDAVLLTPHRDDRAGLPALVDGFVSTYCSVLAEARSGDPRRGLGAQRAYFEAMGRHMRELPALVKIFGAQWTARYFDEAFFGPSWLIEGTEAA